MPKSRLSSPSTPELLNPGFLKQARASSKFFNDHLDSINKKFRVRLRQLGFDKWQAELLARTTPGAALESLRGRRDLRPFLKNVAQAGRDLAKWNVHPNRIAAALGSFAQSVAENDSSATPHELKSIIDRLQLDIILAFNSAYFNVHEAETKMAVRAYQSALEAVDLFTLMRRFIETAADHVGAAAGHIFLMNDADQVWELRGSTSRAVSRLASFTVPVTEITRQKLRRAGEISDSRARSSLLLDPGWSEAWPRCWSVPMFLRGELRGVMQLAFSSPVTLAPRDLDLLAVISEQCLDAAARILLIEDVAGREQRMLELARRMLQIEEIERRRISRELHDDAGQSLVVIRLQMEMIEQSLPPDAAEWRERLAEARDLTENTILCVRRLIGELSPAVMEQLGLAAGLRQLVTRFRRTYPCRMQLHIGKLPQMFPDFQIVVYRLAQECLTNISKHSSAERVNISLTCADRVLRLNVEDDGVGFAVDEGLNKLHCFGLTGMRERVALLGGTCDIRSTPKSGDKSTRMRNSGTKIEIKLPISSNFPSTTS